MYYRNSLSDYDTYHDACQPVRETVPNWASARRKHRSTGRAVFLAALECVTVKRMPLDDPAPTAEGDFRRTPFPHLLVYMADRRLSGVLFLQEPQGLEHVVRFEWGAPVRVMPGDGFALFGEMLVEAGIVREEVVRGALATKGLLGDVLILTGHAEADELESVASEQLLRRMVRLFALPPDTRYRYFEQHDALTSPTPGCRVDVLKLLLEGLRAHPRSGLSLSKLMERLGETPLRMHPDALLERFGWSDEETPVIQAILADRPDRKSGV